MKTLETLFNVEDLECRKVEGGMDMEARLSHRRESEVYRGHFPERPVTPGVLIIAAAVELMEQATGRRLRLGEVKNIKYLTMMTPEEDEGCVVEATLGDDGWATVVYRGVEKCYAKMKLRVED